MPYAEASSSQAQDPDRQVAARTPRPRRCRGAMSTWRTTSASARPRAATTRPTTSSSTSSSTPSARCWRRSSRRCAPRLARPRRPTAPRSRQSAKAWRASATTPTSYADLQTQQATWSTSCFDCQGARPGHGLGHFLVEAVDFITDRLIDFLNGFPRNPVGDHARRDRAAPSWTRWTSRA